MAQEPLILRKLAALYPGAHCSLNFETPFQLLVATILSAQCTDERVNTVTPELFKTFPDANAMAAAKRSEIEKRIRSTGFFKNKAKALSETSQVLVSRFGGNVPQTMAELITLRGIGRKTANVVLGNAWGLHEGIAVDTHVGRLARRLGFSKHKDPVKVEQDLMRVIPKKHWTQATHWLIEHGRAVCQARKPKCDTCPVRALCPKIIN